MLISGLAHQHLLSTWHGLGTGNARQFVPFCLGVHILVGRRILNVNIRDNSQPGECWKENSAIRRPGVRDPPAEAVVSGHTRVTDVILSQ